MFTFQPNTDDCLRTYCVYDNLITLLAKYSYIITPCCIIGLLHVKLTRAVNLLAVITWSIPTLFIIMHYIQFLVLNYVFLHFVLKWDQLFRVVARLKIYISFFFLLGTFPAAIHVEKALQRSISLWGRPGARCEIKDEKRCKEKRQLVRLKLLPDRNDDRCAILEAQTLYTSSRDNEELKTAKSLRNLYMCSIL